MSDVAVALEGEHEAWVEARDRLRWARRWLREGRLEEVVEAATQAAWWRETAKWWRSVRIERTVSRCACGREYDAAAWKALRLDGVQEIPFGGRIELRRCACQSTIAVCATCGRNDCGCKECGAICGESHEDRCSYHEDVFNMLRACAG